MRSVAYAVRVGAVALALGIGSATFGMGVASATESGIVKWFNDTKGFGFITPDSGGKDIYVHFSGISMNGIKTLPEGLRVDYQVTTGPKGLIAIGVRCNSCDYDPRTNRYAITGSAAAGGKAATSKAGPARSAR